MQYVFGGAGGHAKAAQEEPCFTFGIVGAESSVLV